MARVSNNSFVIFLFCTTLNIIPIAVHGSELNYIDRRRNLRRTTSSDASLSSDIKYYHHYSPAILQQHSNIIDDIPSQLSSLCNDLPKKLCLKEWRQTEQCDWISMDDGEGYCTATATATATAAAADAQHGSSDGITKEEEESMMTYYYEWAQHEETILLAMMSMPSPTMPPTIPSTIIPFNDPSCSVCSNGLSVPPTTPVGSNGKTCTDLLFDAGNVDENSLECMAMQAAVYTCCSHPKMIDQVGNNGLPLEVFPLAECKGDCDVDDDCDEGLICYERDNDEPIPGCTIGVAMYSIDYCIVGTRPTYSPATTFAPTASFTNFPTLDVLSSPSSPTVVSKDDRATDDDIVTKTFTTQFDSDTTYAGNMFDIITTDNNIAITSMAINTYLTSALIVKVYTRLGSYKGYEDDITLAWTYVGSTLVIGQGMDRPTKITGIFSNDEEPIVIRKGTRQAFYITSDGPFIRSSTGETAIEWNDDVACANNTDIQLFQGIGTHYPSTHYSGSSSSPQIWNGRIQYHILNDTYFSPKSDEPDTFVRGDLSVVEPQLGIKICTGMQVKVLARANKRISLKDGGISDIPFHSMPDGAAVIPLTNTDGGYVYVSNAEEGGGYGGVGGVYFDKYGKIVDYKMLLTGTRRNCGGGTTPWNTWVSCEEFGNGQCWQVDPDPSSEHHSKPEITKLGGEGGNYETVAVDDRRPRQPIFYVTEDSKFGALRRYIPAYSTYVGWDTLHENGTTTFLIFHNESTFGWTIDEQAARNSQNQYFPNLEGIHFDNGLLYFVSKKLNLLYILDLAEGTYTTSTTKFGIMLGGGEFNHDPDQIVSGHVGDYLYFTEDGGGSPGVYAMHKSTGKQFSMFEGYSDMYKNDETTGLAFSPDGTKMYAAFQDCGCHEEALLTGEEFTCGCLMEFSRQDGLSFEGNTMGLKFHSSDAE